MHTKFDPEYLILHIAATKGLPEQIGPDDTLEVIQQVAELVAADLIDADVARDGVGSPVNVAGGRITYRGRQRLKDLTDARDKKLPLARFTAAMKAAAKEFLPSGTKWIIDV